MPCCAAALITLSLLLYAVHTAVSPPDHVVAQWRQLPPGTPPNIRTEAELNGIPRFVSSIMRGGFGNILFELAASHSVALRLNVTCLVAWWDQEHVRDAKYLPYHGRGDPVPGITLKHVFPNIVYVDFNPATRNVHKKAFAQSTYGGFDPFTRDLLLFRTPFMSGLYFHMRCQSASFI